MAKHRINISGTNIYIEYEISKNGRMTYPEGVFLVGENYPFVGFQVFSTKKELKYAKAVLVSSDGSITQAGPDSYANTSPQKFYNGTYTPYDPAKGDGHGLTSVWNTSQRSHQAYLRFTVQTSSQSYTTTNDGNYITIVGHDLQISVLPFECYRCDEGGSASIDGRNIYCSNMRATISGSASSSDISEAYITIKNLDSGSQVGGQTPVDKGALCGSGVSGIYGGNSLSPGTSYEITLTVKDPWETSSYSGKVTAGTVVVDFSAKNMGGFAIGKFSTSETNQPKFEVASSHTSYFEGPVYFEDAVHFQGTVDGLPASEPVASPSGFLNAGANHYETGVVNTGTSWVDGKPIYRYICNNAIEGSEASITVSDFSLASLDTVISMQGTAYRSDGQWLALPVTKDAGLDFCIEQGESDGTIHFKDSDANHSYSKLVVTVEYTKK